MVLTPSIVSNTRLRISDRLFQISFAGFALFLPFSIAGTNISIGFGVLGWLLSGRVVASLQRAVSGKDAMFVASAGLALFALPSVFMSENATRAWTDWKSYWELLIFFLVAGNIARTGMRQPAFWIVTFSSAVSCLVGFVQRAGGIDLGFIHIGGQHRIGSTLYTMTFAGILYQLVIFTGCVLIVRNIDMKRRLWLGVVAISQFVALLLTMTRGAWLALVAGVVAAALQLRSRRVIAGGVVLLATLIAFSFFYARDQGRNISPTALLNLRPDANVSTRLVLWDIAWDMFTDNPVFGVGFGDYTIEADKRVGDRAVRTTVDTHNVYLHLLATRGLLGFIPFVWYWVAVFRRLHTRKRASATGSLDYQYALAAIAVTIAVLFGALTENNIDDSEVFMAFMFLLGLAVSGELNVSSGQPAPSRQKPQ